MMIRGIAGKENFVKAVIARVLDGANEHEFAVKRWGKPTADALVTRAAVGGIVSSAPLTVVGAFEDEYTGSVFTPSTLGQLAAAGARAVLFHQKTLNLANGPEGFWVGESKQIPLQKMTFTGSALTRKKVAVISVHNQEVVEGANPATETRFREELANGQRGAWNEALLDPDNNGTDERPASILADATPIASTGNPSEDVALLIESFAGDLSTAAFITDPLTAAQIGLSRDSNGAFQFFDVGPKGGSILQIPVIVSRQSPRDTSGGQLALVDAAAIVYALEGIEVSRSTSATLAMIDESVSPPETSMVGLFQTDSIALKSVIYVNWELQNANGVALITGASYPTGTAS